MEGIKLVFDDIQQSQFTSITSSSTWTLLGTFENPCKILLVQNFTDVTLSFSTTGINPKFELPTDGFLLLDGGANKGVRDTASFPEKLNIYVRRVGIPTTGYVNLSTIHLE